MEVGESGNAKDVAGLDRENCDVHLRKIVDEVAERPQQQKPSGSGLDSDFPETRRAERQCVVRSSIAARA